MQHTKEEEASEQYLRIWGGHSTPIDTFTVVNLRSLALAKVALYQFGLVQIRVMDQNYKPKTERTYRPGKQGFYSLLQRVRWAEKHKLVKVFY